MTHGPTTNNDAVTRQPSPGDQEPRGILTHRSHPRTAGAAAMRLLVCILALSACAVRASAEEGCSLKLNQRVLELGELTTVELTCVNTPQPSAPQAIVPDGLELRLLSDMPSQMSQTSIVNGRVSRESRFTFSLQLTGTREGTFTLGPIRIDAEGTSYETDPVTVVVRKTEMQTGTKGDRRVFVETTAEPTSLYVTQTYTATLTIGIRKVEIGGRSYDVDLLRQVLDLGGSQLSVFSGGQARQSEMTLTDQNGERHRYVVYRVEQRLKADEVGETRVGPVFIKARYPTAVQQNIFGRLEFSRVENELARADAIAVTVKGPPVEGRPKSFTGAIGRYLFEAGAKPTRIEQGEPVTLSLTIRGEPLDGVAGPDLAANPELTSRFDFARDELVGDVESGAKTFRRALFPKQTGDQTVPSIEWSYFDPNTERYVTLESKPITISVDQRTGGSETTVSLLPSGPAEPRTPTLTLVSGGLAANYVDADVVLADQSTSISSPSTIAALALPPVLCLIVTLTSRHRAKLRRDVGFARRRKARVRAEAMMHRARQNGAASEHRSLLGDAMTRYLCDRFNLPSGELTPTEAREVLAAHGVEASLVDEVAGFLSACDAAQYAPGDFGHATSVHTDRQVRAWIKRIETQT